MNSLLSPFIHETNDNNTFSRSPSEGMKQHPTILTRIIYHVHLILPNINHIFPKITDNCQEAVTYPTVKNQSTSPNLPNDIDIVFAKAADSPPATVTKVSVHQSLLIFWSTKCLARVFNVIQESPNQASIVDKDTLSATSSQVSSDKTPAKQISHTYAGNKKDEIKIVPTVLPMLSYTSGTPNLYQPIEGVQLFTGAQAQQTTFPTTYQQCVSNEITNYGFFIHIN